MARVKAEGKYSDTDRILAFYQRATQIRKHPLFGHPDASKIRPIFPGDVSLHDVVDSGSQPIEGFDYKLFAPGEWLDLACLVRPLVFTSTDNIRLQQILSLISQASAELKQYTDLVNSDFKKWVKTTFFYAGAVDIEPESAESNTVQIAEDLDFDVSEMSGDYKMAMNYFNGELFHVNMDHWNYMSQFTGGQVRSMYLKAAQFRAIDACRHTENVRQIIMVGWITGHLPVPPAMAEAVETAEPPSAPLMINLTQSPESAVVASDQGDGQQQGEGSD